ncbi:MAG: UDP-2,3-diacylglucosamine diphosphatase [Planctomycetota bacterium]|nr:MAG: UDP-2,3-diacylglucosamine diphosphatase [Planctomycetota bacterium]
MSVAAWPAEAAVLEPGTLVIADLHLDPAGEGRVTEFVAWLARVRAARAPALLVLGDLFDVWVGPVQAEHAGAAAVSSALAELAETARVVVLHGNRDFLLGEAFERATGCRVFEEGYLGRLPGAKGPESRVVFVHGDQFCTRDRSYQRLKRVLRSAPVRALAPRVPYAVAGWAASRLRGASQRAVPAKPKGATAMQPEAVTGIARSAAAGTVVCGHGHVFRDEQLADGTRWIVLDSWGGERDLLRIDEGSLSALSHADA